MFTYPKHGYRFIFNVLTLNIGCMDLWEMDRSFASLIGLTRKLGKLVQTLGMNMQRINSYFLA